MDYNEVKTAKDKLEKIIKKQEFPHLIKGRREETLEEKKRTVDKAHVINKINYLNFQDKTITINFKHRKYNRFLSRQASPLPCFSDQLDCLWTKKTITHNILSAYQFHNIVITDGQNLLTLKPELINIYNKGVSFKLPEKCFETTIHKARRHSCHGLNVQLIQNSALFQGSLAYFNAISFHVEISKKCSQTFQWINPEATVSIILSNKDETLYTGECRIIREIIDQNSRSYILEPLNSLVQRFKPQKFRSKRQTLIPSPNIIFKHPFTGKMVDLKVYDLAGSGFSVEDDLNNPVLLPGMIIPELELSFAGSFKALCKAQVVYRNSFNEEQKKDREKCGMVFLDMGLEDHMSLLSVLYQAENKNSYICNRVDQEALWEFFFKAGFIYPKKYAYIQSKKDRIKDTYHKLYSNGSNIARHFIYQDKGNILAHMAILRFYENTWLIQHHASLAPMVKAGLVVMNQMGRFTYDSHRLNSIHMDYLIGYYRYGNKFPDLIFGGAARSIKDPKGCSLDNFAYFYHSRTYYNESALPAPWRLTRSNNEDLKELQNFYELESGGLMVNALDLETITKKRSDISGQYKRLGFKRNRFVLSLKKYEDLIAIIVVNISNVGLNMSDLTNCIKVFVLDQDDFSRDTLYLSLSLILNKIHQNRMPVLIYPAICADNHDIPYDKTYTLWTLNSQFSDSYFKHIKRLLKFQSS